jgi:hypothetical protein
LEVNAFGMEVNAFGMEVIASHGSSCFGKRAELVSRGYAAWTLDFSIADTIVLLTSPRSGITPF